MTGFRSWQDLSALLKRHEAAVSVSVLDVRGSAPREIGARMLVTGSGQISGTIGGGALEFDAISRARALLRGERPAFETETVPLGPRLAQCCGGSVTLLYETMTLETAWVPGGSFLDSDTASVGLKRDPETGRRVELSTSAANAAGLGADTPILLDDNGTLFERVDDGRMPVAVFGAGHVGRALILALAALPVRVSWFDSRADMFPTAIPRNVDAIALVRPEPSVASLSPGSPVLIMTHSHPLDLAITEAALSRHDLGPVGLIGSQTKRQRFVSQLRMRTDGAVLLDRLVCPIGISGIEGKDPAVIAASVAAQVLQWGEAAVPATRPAPAREEA